MAETSQSLKHERIWDPLVRLFHWSLVAAFATAWWGRGESWIHEGAGKIVLILIICRTIWGLIGTGAARFENFIRGPKTVLRYMFLILCGKPTHFVGHNPAGAAMIGLMLLTLAVTATSGILMSTTALWGNPLLEATHGAAAYAMLFLIAGHLLGILVAAIQHRENLVLAMITGKKWVADNTIPYLGSVQLGDKPVLMSVAFVALAAALWQGSTTVLNASVWRMHKTVAAELAKLECEDAAVQMPRIEIYPAILVNYVIASPSTQDPEILTLSSRQALEKRPAIDFSAIKEWCAGLKAHRAAQDAKPVADMTGSLPAIEVPLAEFPAVAMAIPDISHSLELPEPAMMIASPRPSSATAMIARQDMTQFAELPGLVQVIPASATIEELPKTSAQKKPAPKFVKRVQAKPKVKTVLKRKLVLTKRRPQRGVNQFTENGSRDNGLGRNSSGSSGRGDWTGNSGGSGSGSGSGGGNSGSGTGGNSSGGSGSGSSSGSNGGSGNSGSGNGGSGSDNSGSGSGNSGSGSDNSGSGSGNSGSGSDNSGRGSGNSGRGGGSDDSDSD